MDRCCTRCERSIEEILRRLNDAAQADGVASAVEYLMQYREFMQGADRDCAVFQNTAAWLLQETPRIERYYQRIVKTQMPQDAWMFAMLDCANRAILQARHVRGGLG